MAFTNWSSIQPAIALVPASAGQLVNVSVINFGATVYTGPLNVANTLNRIRADSGPDRTDDGIVYSSPQASGLPVDGTYYEFTVESAAGTDRNFTSSFSDPGPMRILLATGGDCFFTGDHYSTFTSVYIYSASTPTIGALAANPTSVAAGNAAVLTASNVSDSGATISSVAFYRESNGTSGLQTATDTLIGNGTASGTSWTISAPTTSLTAGTYTYYAVATDSAGTISATASTTLSVTGSTSAGPTIGALSPSPATVPIGGSSTLTASGVTETGGTISSVSFYRETNSTAGLQIGSDTLLGSGTQSGTTWTFATATTGLTAGTYTYYAVAKDAAAVSSAAASTSLTVTSVSAGNALEAWDVNGQTAFGAQGLAATSIATGIISSLGLTRGAGVSTTGGTAASNAWGGTNFAASSAAGLAASSTVSFGLTVSPNYSASLSSIDLNYRRSSSGPANGYWQYQLNGGTWALIGDFSSEFSSTATTGASITELPLTGITSLQNLAANAVVNFRLVPYGGSSGGTWYVYDMTGNDLVINGSAGVAASTLILSGPAEYLKLDSDGINIDLWANSVGPGSASPQKLILSQISDISFTGSTANDALTVDFSAGDPLPATALAFAASGNGSLKVIGTAASDNLMFTASTASLGAASINYSGVSSIVVDPNGGNDSLSVANAVVSLPTPAINSAITTRAFSTLAIGTGGVVNVPAQTVNGKADHADRMLLTAANFSDSGTLDLGDGDMVIHSGAIGNINSLLQSGYSATTGGQWTGTGIVSSVARSDATRLTSLGAIQNSIDGSANGSVLYGSAAPLGTFDGSNVLSSDVLIKYTYFGDANLDGRIDGSDYTRIDAGQGTIATGWYNGDFNYDSSVNGLDYTLIDNAFNSQLVTLAASVASRTVPATSADNHFIIPNFMPQTSNDTADRKRPNPLSAVDILRSHVR